MLLLKKRRETSIPRVSLILPFFFAAAIWTRESKYLSDGSAGSFRPFLAYAPAQLRLFMLANSSVRGLLVMLHPKALRSLALILSDA